jgi:hypothetical protein
VSDMLLAPPGFTVHKMPEGSVAATVHVGPYAGIGRRMRRSRRTSARTSSTQPDRRGGSTLPVPRSRRARRGPASSFRSRAFRSSSEAARHDQGPQVHSSISIEAARGGQVMRRQPRPWPRTVRNLVSPMRKRIRRRVARMRRHFPAARPRWGVPGRAARRSMRPTQG